MGVDPSSLIFVVIIGIWAVYLVQHWVRRREQLATSRSLDRFSDAMRVLERRAPIPVPLPVSPNRPYVVAPARSQPAPAAAAPTVAAARTSRTEVAMKQATTARTDRLVAASRPGRQSPRRTHRVRALVLLGLLVATPSVWAAHIFGTLLLWPTLTVTALFVLDLLLVRSAVRRAATQRRTVARRAAPGVVRPAAAPARRQRAAAKRFPVAPAREVLAAGGSTVRSAAPAASAVVVEEVVRVHSQEAVTEVIVLDGGWEPVAVPPPTYTMKPKAQRSATAGMAPLTADSESAPSREPLQPAVVIDELDLDSVLDRRRAAGE